MVCLERRGSPLLALRSMEHPDFLFSDVHRLPPPPFVNSHHQFCASTPTNNLHSRRNRPPHPPCSALAKNIHLTEEQMKISSGPDFGKVSVGRAFTKLEGYPLNSLRSLYTREVSHSIRRFPLSLNYFQYHSSPAFWIPEITYPSLRFRESP